MTAIVRRAELADVERLGELHSACWAELYPTVLPPEVLAQLSPATMSGLWEKFVTRGDSYLQWVAVDDSGEIVGFAGTGPGREEGYEIAVELYFIYVTPSARRSGVGRALLKQADADYLWIWEDNRDSRAFYRKQKYFPDSVARAGALFGQPLPEVRMAR
jgi:GNAT superfamily N-acetyltransferase